MRRDGRVAEGARLESVYARKGIQGSNPCLSARFLLKLLIILTKSTQIERELVGYFGNVWWAEVLAPRLWEVSSYGKSVPG
jgi:hypothetical protein